MKFPYGGGAVWPKNFLCFRHGSQNFNFFVRSASSMKFPSREGDSSPKKFSSPRPGPKNFQSPTFSPEHKSQFHKQKWGLARKFFKSNFCSRAKVQISHMGKGEGVGLSPHFATQHDCITHANATPCDGMCKISFKNKLQLVELKNV